ncbi:hypothetical protein CRENBAI_012630 [Crenichthys baileyi]|uniref:Uncharacterized protein n=1 Tax=Crenichthys baileyi TaxID=28760 RepID=A0AAV9SIS8_9TELE
MQRLWLNVEQRASLCACFRESRRFGGSGGERDVAQVTELSGSCGVCVLMYHLDNWCVSSEQKALTLRHIDPLQEPEKEA